MKKTFIDLYIVRHGETHWNSEKKLQGQTDIELSDLGRKQAVAAKNHFEGIQFHSFFSSDLNRAFETVEIIKTELSQTHKNTVKLPLLRERNFGDLEGKYYDEVHAHYSEIGYDKLPYEEKLLTCVANGESLKQLLDRCLGFIDHVKKEVEEETAENLNILVVSHGGFMKQLYMHITSQFEASNLGFENLGYFVVRCHSTGLNEVIKHNGMNDKRIYSKK